MSAKEEFIEIFRENVHREGAENLLDYLMNKSDFFTAPASGRYHGAYPGGLCEHSLNVYHCLVDYLSRERVNELYGLEYSEETVALVAEALCKNLALQAGDKTFVMINGCGATTMMEMLVLFKDTVEFLKAKGVEVVASMVGEILTVQEAGGFQMNIAKWDDETLRLWNTPCHTPAYSKE